MRWMGIAALGVALAMALALPFGNEAEAKKKVSVAKSKACIGTTFEGKKVSFRCKANEVCCFDGLMAKGNCVPAGQLCF